MLALERHLFARCPAVCPPGSPSSPNLTCKRGTLGWRRVVDQVDCLCQIHLRRLAGHGHHRRQRRTISSTSRAGTPAPMTMSSARRAPSSPCIHLGRLSGAGGRRRFEWRVEGAWAARAGVAPGRCRTWYTSLRWGIAEWKSCLSSRLRQAQFPALKARAGVRMDPCGQCGSPPVPKAVLRG
jgi:hypothetical protein